MANRARQGRKEKTTTAKRSCNFLMEHIPERSENQEIGS